MKRLYIMVVLLCATICAFAQTYPFQNPELTPQQRAQDLCSRLTLEEKVRLMQNESPAVPRLGVPAFQWWNEALHGVGRNGIATVFPIPMAMASSFDDALLEEVFTAVSDEARVKNNQAKREGTQGQLYHNLSFYTPNINIFRDPRWGRGQETYGEDPYLTERMGISVVRGLQGPDDSKYRKLLACAKHFAVHSGPEWNRHVFDVENLPQRDLFETYLPAFKALVQKANVEEVMCAYNRFEGKPCCGSDRLLYHILRNDWGYKGLVTSDCGAIWDFYHMNGYSKDGPEATSVAVSTGTDLTCGTEYEYLPEAVKRGLITEEQIDVSLCRLLEARFRLGDMTPDEQVSWTKVSDDVVASEAHRQLALKMAHETVVLLQNKNNVLPLKKDAPVVVLGPNANDSTMQWGNYNGFPKHTVTMLEGIKQVGKDVTYDYVPDYKTVETEQLIASIPEGSTVVFVGGITPRLEGEQLDGVDEPGFKGGDRTTIELPTYQRNMLKALKDAGYNVVFVNCSGSAIALSPETQSCDAILQAWYGGEWGGKAVADILYGDVNPSGKLPVTLYKNDSQLPDFEDYTMKNRTYRYMTEEPLFAFGYGLSYSQFKVSSPKIKDGKIVVKVSNKGKRDGAETVQVYLSHPDDAEGPHITLRAFQRVELKAGETKTVTITPDEDFYNWWDASTNTMHQLPGRYDIYVGTSSRMQDLKKKSVEI